MLELVDEQWVLWNDSNKLFSHIWNDKKKVQKKRLLGVVNGWVAAGMRG